MDGHFVASVLRKNTRDRRGLAGNRERQRQENAGFLRIEVVGDEKAVGV